MFPSSSVLLLSPARYDMYKGIKGRTHGEKKDKRPSKKVVASNFRSISPQKDQNDDTHQYSVDAEDRKGILADIIEHEADHEQGYRKRTCTAH